MWSLADGEPPTLWFNESLLTDEADCDGITRHASECRPLSLRNTGSKVIASAANHTVSPVAPAATHPSQRGFALWRRLAFYGVELGGFARAAACKIARDPVAYDTPLLVTFDFEVASPIVTHVAMEMSLEGVGAPSGFLAIAWGLVGAAYSTLGGGYCFLVFARSGIVQGRPLIGFSFTVSLEPVLRRVCSAFAAARAGALRAFADDLGAALLRRRGLLALRAPFRAAADAWGLRRKPRKCCIVSVAARRVDQAAVRLRDWLLEVAPDWAALASHALYLGVQIGPRAGAHMWTAASGAPAAAAADLYKTRALPTLHYLTQFSPPTGSRGGKLGRLGGCVTFLGTLWGSDGTRTCRR